MRLTIAVSSGKGGTGKTFVSTNTARALERLGERVRYLDCDVEEPNGHLFLKPEIDEAREVTLSAPAGADPARCTRCGRCVEACAYHALARVKDSILFFRNLCHVCGACSLVCPEKAITVKPRKIGELKRGRAGGVEFVYGLLETGEGGMTPRLIRRVKEGKSDGVTLLDSPPGTSCPVVETVRDADLCVLVTDPTPFGVNDLKLAVDMCRSLDREPVVVVNRAEYLTNDLRDYCAEAELDIIGEIPDEWRAAECYSRGMLAADAFPEYEELFRELALRMLDYAGRDRPVRRKPAPRVFSGNGTDAAPDGTAPAGCTAPDNRAAPAGGEGTPRNEVVVISGKGGTGKTSLTASFAALEGTLAIADCDVDAADLHLVLKPDVREHGLFSGGKKARVIPERCTGCGSCMRACRFGAVRRDIWNGTPVYRIAENGCEGCGVCAIVCGARAVLLEPAVNGEWFVSETRFGPMTHAALGAAEENSGKLVSLIRGKKSALQNERNLERSLSDGSPGTGCPVIASLTGSDYAVVVTEPTVSGVHDLKRILEVIRFFNLRSGVVVNKHDLNRENTEEIRAAAASYGADFLGLIPYDKTVTRAQLEARSVVEYDAAAPAARSAAEIWTAVRERLKGVFRGG